MTASLLFLACACGCVPVRGPVACADLAVRGEVTVVNIPWTFPDGRIDWLFNPTQAKGPFNPEWQWQLNRMSFWNDLATAYEQTKDEKYARAFARQLCDWLDQTGGVPPEKDYNAVGSPWRTIEEGLRLMGSWHRVRTAFAGSPAFTPALKARFLAAASAQAKHLMAHLSPRGNWLLMELNGVYTFATDTPELAESEKLRKESARRMLAALSEQILPDGLQYELSPDYHSVAVGCAAQMYATAARTGFAAELPPAFAELLQRMGTAVLNLTTPSFVQPRFNDCFTIHGDSIVGRFASCFPARADLAWLASRRRQGAEPRGETASRYLPWSGFAVMRSGWDEQATYLCFDVGPLGMGHWHQDKLSFTLWKGAEELVFDDGGGQYERSPERTYGLSAYDHNTLLVDGLAQNRQGPLRVTEPVDAAWSTSSVRDSAVGVYDQGFGPSRLNLARQRREIVFEKARDLFRVTDAVSSADGRAHAYQLLFQLDTTNTTISAKGTRLRARYGRAWDLELTVEKGGVLATAVAQRQPRLAGWFIGRNDMKNHPATTVFVTAPKGVAAEIVTTFHPVAAHTK